MQKISVLLHMHKYIYIHAYTYLRGRDTAKISEGHGQTAAEVSVWCPAKKYLNLDMVKAHLGHRCNMAMKNLKIKSGISTTWSALVSTHCHSLSPHISIWLLSSICTPVKHIGTGLGPAALTVCCHLPSVLPFFKIIICFYGMFES